MSSNIKGKKVTNIEDYLVADVFACITSISSSGYVLTAESASNIDSLSDDGLDVCFNKLPPQDNECTYNAIVASALRSDKDASLFIENGFAAVYFQGEPSKEAVLNIIDEACS